MARKNSWLTEPVTPYRLAGILSAAMNEALGSEDFNIAPQQVYGAVRSGSLETEVFDSGHKKVTVEAGNAFIQARIDRQLAKNQEAEESESETEESVEVTS